MEREPYPCHGDTAQVSLEADSSEITALVESCKRHLSTLSSTEVESAPEARVQLARLNVWARNMGVFVAGHQSFVSRLNGSHEVGKVIFQQLVFLESILGTLHGSSMLPALLTLDRRHGSSRSVEPRRQRFAVGIRGQLIGLLLNSVISPRSPTRH